MLHKTDNNIAYHDVIYVERLVIFRKNVLRRVIYLHNIILTKLYSLNYLPWSMVTNIWALYNNDHAEDHYPEFSLTNYGNFLSGS